MYVETRQGHLTWPYQVHLSDGSIAWFTRWLLMHHRPDIASNEGGYPALFNAVEAIHAKSLVIVMVPAFAGAVAMLSLDRRSLDLMITVIEASVLGTCTSPWARSTDCRSCDGSPA